MWWSNEEESDGETDPKKKKKPIRKVFRNTRSKYVLLDNTPDGRENQATIWNLEPTKTEGLFNIRVKKPSGDHDRLLAPTPLERWYFGAFEEERFDYLGCVAGDGQKPKGVIGSVAGQFIKGADQEWALVPCGDGSDEDPGNIYRMRLHKTKPEPFPGINYLCVPDEGGFNRDDDSSYAGVIDESMPLGAVYELTTAEWFFNPVPVPKPKKGEKEPNPKDYEHLYKIRVGKMPFNTQMELALFCVRTNLDKDTSGDDKARCCCTNPYKWLPGMKCEWKLEPGSSKDLWKIKVHNMPESEHTKGWYLGVQKMVEDAAGIARYLVTVQDPTTWPEAAMAEWRFEKGSGDNLWKLTLAAMPLRTRAEGCYLTATREKDSERTEYAGYVSVQNAALDSMAAAAQWEFVPVDASEFAGGSMPPM